MSGQIVLVVDDEPAFAEALQVGLTREGFVVHLAESGPRALELFEKHPPDVVLLDVMLPGMSGIDVCRQIRLKSTVPIIMVSARADELDAVVGLEVGADDYVTKPYRLRELVARIGAVQRRRLAAAGVGPPAAVSSDAIVAGDVSVDLDRHEVRVRGELVQLPLKEFELLTLLVGNAGRVVTRETIIDRVWGYDYDGVAKTIDVHVKRIRQKVERDPSNPEHIVTIRGVGYKFIG
jgi:two-component system, OmpR family, response regulator RegX3